jgi:hypothetical protein
VSDLFLGLIAVALLVMAAIQVAAIVVALRFIRRLDQFAGRLEQEIRPVIDGLKALTTDATRATSAFRSVLSIFRADRKARPAAARDDEGPLFVG